MAMRKNIVVKMGEGFSVARGWTWAWNTAFGFVGVSMSWGIFAKFWAWLPLFSQITLGIGLGLLAVLCLSQVAYWLTRGPPIWKEFEEELLEFSERLELIVLTIDRLYAAHAKGEDPPWRDHAGSFNTVFPSGGNRDPRLLAFALAVYPKTSEHTDLYRRSPLAEGVLKKREFWRFHRARRALTRDVQHWAIQTVGDSKARRYAEARLGLSSTRRVLKVVAYLEVALADALGNDDPTQRENLAWYDWLSEWVVKGSGGAE